jgi:transcriptional regulator with XRE-family HTH domain
VAKRTAPRQTLDDLIATRLAKGQTVTAWADANGIPRRTLSRMRQGKGEPHLGTVVLLAQALGVDPARVRAAIAASRAAAGK